ncbi:hypothetical protein D7004_14280 [Pedobacter jejuensis]|uniref:TonB-dependent receptor n=1 Tax=Pedobacter jejuensis TaxID=1268550 RepID=A0A3N0BRN1_9SPHI|nr:hypothetical protein D7004_14280 [Pedobacter jejuensis]
MDVKAAFLSFIISICLNTSFAQNIKINGTVRSGSISLPSATIQLKNAVDGDLLFYGITDDIGRYEIGGSLEHSEKLILIASYIGFKNDTVKIERSLLLEKNIFNKDFVLTENSKQLDELYVKAPSAVQVDNDTTKYAVKQFTSPDDRSLESVLKKMPGIEVVKDGTLFFKGRKVSKVLLENDDLTGEKYKTITKNLKPEFVEEVQALEHYIEDNLLKGIINSDDVVLNLKLRDKKALKTVGSIDAAAGTNDRAMVSTNLISLLNNTKAFSFGKYSNLNNDLEGDILSLSDDNRQLFNPNQIIKHNLDTYNPFDNMLYTPNRNLQGSTSAITRLSKKLKINYSIYYGWNKQFGLTEVKERYFPPNEVQTDTYDDRALKLNKLNIEMGTDYFVRDNGHLNIKFTIRSEPETFDSQAFTVFNNTTGDSVFQRQNDRDKTLSGQIKYTYKVDKNTALLATGRVNMNQVNQEYNVSSSLYAKEPLFDGQTSLTQLVNNKTVNVKFELEGLKKINRNFLHINIGNELTHFGLQSDLNNEKKGLSLSPNFTNDNTFIFNQTYLSSKYIITTEDETFKIIGLLRASLQSLKSMGRDSSYFFLEPNLNIQYKPDQVQNISFNYKFKNNVPNPLDYYTSFILTDIRNFNSGLSRFYNFNTHTVSLNYGYNDFLNSFFNINASLIGSYSKYGFLYTSSFENTLNYSTKQPFKGLKNIISSINSKKFFPALALNLTTTYSLSLSNYYLQLGNATPQYYSLTNLINVKFNTGFKWPINFGAGVEILLNRTTGENNFAASNNAYKYTFDYHYKISKNFYNVLLYNLYNMNKAMYNLVDTEIQYNPDKGNFKYSIQGKNLANIKAFSTRNINEISSITNSSTILGRYITFNISMNIK